MKTIWQTNAVNQFNNIVKYLFTNFGRRTVINFVKDTKRTEKIILKNPQIAPLEPLLEGTAQIYRSINIDNINKMVYYIDGQVIYISIIWDTRRCPENIVTEI